MSFILMILSFWLGNAWAENKAPRISPGTPPGVLQDSAWVGLEIDRIDISGVKSVPSIEIEGALELAPGDRLEKLKVLKTEENLQALYIHRGFEQVRVRARLVQQRDESKRLETILKFDVQEGLPVRIASIHIVPVGLNDSNLKKYWKKREKKINASMGVVAGDVHDQTKLEEGQRALQELLVSAEYIGVKVEQSRTVTQFPQELATAHGLTAESASQWVNLEYKVYLGERVSFGFRGNSVFTRGYLSALADEQRLLGLGKNYIGVIRSKLEDEYLAAGFARVEVTPYTFETSSQYERRVTYVIQEGPKVRISSIDFDGNAVFSTAELRKKFYSKASSLIQHGYYVEKDIQKAAELLVEWMKEKGYLSARLITTNSVYLPKNRNQKESNLVRSSIYLYEGDQTLVQDLYVQGATVFTPQEIFQLLKLEKGSPLNLFTFGDGIEAIKKAYRDQGYLNFKVLNEGSDGVVRYAQENRIANVFLQFEEGPQFKVSQIQVEGLSNTLESVVRREIRFRENEVLRESDIIQTERQLRRLGIFASVEVRDLDDPAKPGYRMIRVNVREADRGVVAGGPGVRNDLGVRLFGQLSYTNLWGKNHNIAVSAATNRRFYRYQFAEGQALVSYMWPWFLGMSDLNFRPTISVGRTQYFNFWADSLSLSFNWDKRLLSNPNLTGYLSYTLERILQSGAIDVVDNQGLQIATVTPRVSVDLRDSPLAPTSGYYGIFWSDLAFPSFGSQSEPPIGYYRLQMRNDYYLPLTKGITWYFSARMGYEQTLNSNDTSAQSQYFIPLIKQFQLGGIGSMRGYQEQELNNPFSLSNGSLSYVNYRTQLDLPFAGALKFGVFLDAGNLLVNSFSLGGLRYGTGFGFHYQTPVGPVNFDWGFKIDPPPGADPYVIHFSVGVL
jgi:outer membrane protein assembly complex protein YaeT